MNCQHASEHEHNKHPLNAEQQPMEIPDYLHLASFIQYLKNDTADGQPMGGASYGEQQLA